MAECHSSLKVCFQSTGGCADDCHWTAVQLKENHESNKSQPSHEESLPVDLRMFFHHEYKVKQNFNLLNGNWTPKSVWAAQSNASFTAFLEPVERSHCISALTHEAPHVSTTQRAEFSESNWNEITLQSTRLMVWFAAKLGHASACPNGKQSFALHVVKDSENVHRRPGHQLALWLKSAASLCCCSSYKALAFICQYCFASPGKQIWVAARRNKKHEECWKICCRAAGGIVLRCINLHQIIQD